MWRAAVVVLCLFSTSGLIASDLPQAGPFVVDTLLEGVWLFRVPADSAEYTNSLVVERHTGLLVVESQPSPEAARRLIEAIRTVSPKPIRYLVLSHAHVESSGGASAFPESTLVMSSVPTHEALLDDVRDLGADIPRRAQDPDTWVAPPRVLPAMLIAGMTVLADGAHKIDLLPVAQGHYPGSIVVRIEDAGLYYVGSMATASRNPYADAEHSNIRSWLAWLNSLLFARPETIVPIRGEAFGVRELRSFRDVLAWAVSQTDHGIIERLSKEETLRNTIEQPKFGELFDLEARPSFANEFLDSAFTQRNSKR